MNFEQQPTPQSEKIIKKEGILSKEEFLKSERDYKLNEQYQKKINATDEKFEKLGEIKQDKNKENLEKKIIKFPEDINIIKALQRKLKEYKGRKNALEAKKNLYIPPEIVIDTNYKIAILEKLLTEGEINIKELSQELINKYGSLHFECFDNACAVIEDYVNTGGKKVIGGTGLKFDEKQQESKEKDEREKDEEDIMEKLTFENIKNSLKIGKPIEVKIKRSSGEIEKGWIVISRDDKNVIVIKKFGEGALRRIVPIKEIQELNKKSD